MARSIRASALGWWALLGAAGTWLDHLHQRAGVTVYDDPSWIGQRAPVSPVYVVAALGAYLTYAAVVGLPAGARGRLGGAPVGWARGVRAVGEFTAAYGLTALLSGRGLADGAGPFVCAALLVGWALPWLWARRRTRVPVFAALVVMIGPAFEWQAVTRGAFAYGVCPSRACLGAPVAMAWLPWLYLHFARLMDVLLGDGAGA